MDALSKSPSARNQVEFEYLTESMRPLVILVFIAPMLVVYELGVIGLGPQAVRNGADVWMREWLDKVGFSQYFLLPLLTCGILLGWHHLTHQRWQVPGQVIAVMWLESVILALVLLVIAHVQVEWIGDLRTSITCDTSHGSSPASLERIVAYLGAGIYEELLFRLMLLPATIAAFRYVQMTPKASIVAGVILSSALFSLAHYRLEFRFLLWQISMTHGYPFEWFSFVFRFSAGVFFSLLFLFRGFGIAVGSHAIYDILAVLL